MPPEPRGEATDRAQEDASGDRTSLHVGRAIDGCQDSLSWLVERLSPLLLAQARYRLGPALASRCDAEDIVHDAWLTLLPRLGSLPARDGRSTPVLLKFLGTTILNRVRNLLREHTRESAEPMPTAELTAEQSGAVTKAIRIERADVVHEALAALDARDHEVVLLRGVEQLPARVVSMLTDASEEAVAKRYQRALVKLRGRLAGSVFDDLDQPAAR